MAVDLDHPLWHGPLMGRDLTRRAVLGALMAGGAAPLWAEGLSVSQRPVARPALGLFDPPRPVARPDLPQADDIIRQHGLRGQTVYALVDQRSGLVLEQSGSSTPLPPASVAKAITAVYALDTLGPAFRFETRVMVTGPVRDGIVEGDVILAGGGDPGLDSDDLAGLAAQMATAGIKGVQGRLRVWSGALPEVYEIDEIQPVYVGYNPAISGLNLNYNRVHFDWKRGPEGEWNILMDARTRARRPEVRSARMTIVDRQSPTFTYEGNGAWTVASRALGNGGARWLPVRRPGLYAGEVFRAVAREFDITLPAPEILAAPQAGRVVARHESAPLQDIVRSMLRFSTNLTAEVVGLAASKARGAAPATLRASAQEMNAWVAETLGQEMALRDHSGLSGASRVTCGALAGFFAKASVQATLAPVLKDYPLRNDAQKVVENHPAAVKAKTGTLNFVSTLAGYVTGVQGQTRSFVIMSADLPRREALTGDAIARPPGGRQWARASRGLQQKLVQAWSLNA